MRAMPLLSTRIPAIDTRGQTRQVKMPMSGMVEILTGANRGGITQQLRVAMDAGKAKSRSRRGRLFLSRKTKIGFT